MSDFNKFGYQISGVPIGKPIHTEEPLLEVRPNTSVDENDKYFKLDERIVEALATNAEIDPNSVCIHPFAILDLPANKEPTMLSRKNYVKKEHYNDVEKPVHKWF